MAFLPVLSPNGARYTAFLFSSAATSIGVYAFTAPAGAAVWFGLPSHAKSPFFQAEGARDITLGLAYALFARQRNISAIKTLMICRIIIGATDSVIVWRFGDRERSWGHIIGTGVLVIMAGQFLWAGL